MVDAMNSEHGEALLIRLQALKNEIDQIALFVREQITSPGRTKPKRHLTDQEIQIGMRVLTKWPEGYGIAIVVSHRMLEGVRVYKLRRPTSRKSVTIPRPATDLFPIAPPLRSHRETVFRD